MIKTITDTDIEAFDAHVNAFEKTHSVFATQTHVLRNEGMKTEYVAVVFYRNKIQIRNDTEV